MSNKVSKVIYKPDSQSTDEYMVVVDSAEYKKWKDGDTSIPLALVVGCKIFRTSPNSTNLLDDTLYYLAFDIFHSGQGAQGQMGKVSKQMLDTVFGTSKDDEAVKILLERGTYQEGASLSKNTGDTNMGRGSGNVGSRGAVGGGR
ncbi:hypothetical protein FRB95_000018 [Tulasnella sp. JGI-2019a]|nr:hypothetical protein FRB95_000018 [Tulasnella sp. JGI-2019a]